MCTCIFYARVVSGLKVFVFANLIFFLFRLMNVLSGRVGFQLQYQLIFCLWCLTFNEDISSRLDKYVHKLYQVCYVLA